MALVFKSVFDDPVSWAKALRERVPGLELRVWPEVGDVEEVEYALVWKPEHGDLKRYPNLKVILSLAAGVDHIFENPELPDVPVCRIVDPDLIHQMSEYALYFTLRYHRKMAGYEQAQRDREWRKLGRCDTSARKVGVMGIGAIGSDTARKIAGIGFPVLGWSRSPKQIDGIRCLHGRAGLDRFLAETEILVCVLPLTDQTRGILNRERLSKLPQGAWVINMARGAHIVDEDLIALLDEGHLSGAALDVFAREPLPKDHSFWTHPKVQVTPHIAGDPNPRTAADQIAENIRRARDGQPLRNVVDPKEGY